MIDAILCTVQALGTVALVVGLYQLLLHGIYR